MKTMTQEFSMNQSNAWQSTAATAAHGSSVVLACALSTVTVEGVAVRAAADETRRLRVAHAGVDAAVAAKPFGAFGAFAARPQGRGLGLIIPATETTALPGPSAWSPPV
ncbi:hypothetical protein [Nocardioides sp.]|uniref:hypothetical protein n=1 Tax=Nocardioides sp. TaxID=35761 RepID=UPI0035165691